MSSQLTLPLDISEAKSFDNFVEAENAPIVAHLKYRLSTQLDAKEPTYHGVIIWGEASSGKTHLMMALSRVFHQLGGDVQWIGPEMGEQDIASGGDLKTLYVVDDIEALVQAPDGEKSLLTIIEKIKQENGLLYISAKHAPSGMQIGLADLSSRLRAIDCFELQALSEAHKRTLLTRWAHARGFVLNQDVVNWLFTHTSRDLGRMYDLMEQIDAVSLAQHRRVTIPFIKSIIEQT